MLKKSYLFFFIVIIGLFLNFSSVLAVEKIDNYSVDISINSDSSLDITETIDYNFGNSSHHGIYRDIIYKYPSLKGNFNLRISNINVIDENNRPYKFKVLNSGAYKKIKIGDKDKYVTGKKIYKISYTVKRAIGYFSDHDELYWNAVGVDWNIPISNSSVNVHLPKKLSSNQVQTSCYAGRYESKIQCNEQEYNSSTGVVSFTNGSLRAREGLSVVVGLPVGTLTQPSKFYDILYFLQDNYPLFLPPIVFVVMFYLWWTRGRDPKGRGTIITQFDAPDNLTPLQVGILIDEKAQNKDLSAEIIHLAIQGHLKIEKIKDKKDYILHKQNLKKEIKNESDRLFMKKLFQTKDNVKISDLKYEFTKDAGKIMENAYTSMVKGNYFAKNPNKVKRNYFVSAVVAMLVFSFLVAQFGNEIMVISVIISCFIVVAFSFFMPARTKKGVLAREHVLGLKNYLNVAEKDRINFHNAPEKNPKIFEKFLPFAMVLGVEKNWAKQFEKIYNQEPDWYHGDSRSFSAVALADSLKDFNSFSKNNLTAVKSSGGSGLSGGGFSGGGFGGGGGGSW